MLMNLGCLVTITAAAPVNYTLIVFDNSVYEVTGGQSTAAAPRTAHDRPRSIHRLLPDRTELRVRFRLGIHPPRRLAHLRCRSARRARDPRVVVPKSRTGPRRRRPPIPGTARRAGAAFRRRAAKLPWLRLELQQPAIEQAVVENFTLSVAGSVGVTPREPDYRGGINAFQPANRSASNGPICSYNGCSSAS